VAHRAEPDESAPIYWRLFSPKPKPTTGQSAAEEKQGILKRANADSWFSLGLGLSGIILLTGGAEFVHFLFAPRFSWVPVASIVARGDLLVPIFIWSVDASWEWRKSWRRAPTYKVLRLLGQIAIGFAVGISLLATVVTWGISLAASQWAKHSRSITSTLGPLGNHVSIITYCGLAIALGASLSAAFASIKKEATQDDD
jgi:hypothetical protein